jgi:TonB family protein
MSDLRSLLRFDEKLAAEGRRLQNLGGPSMRWVAPTVLIVAVLVHALILLLPAVRSASASPAVRPVPNFPRVWRITPPVTPPPEPPAALPLPAVPVAPAPAVEQPVAARVRRPFATEPLLEPAPEIALSSIPADIEAIIPNPSPPPPSAEIGPPERVPSTPTPSAEPVLIEQVAPVYPVAARSLGAEARVTLRLRVLADGSVGGATVLDCSRTGLGFEVAALEAVKRWRYVPDPLQSGARKVVVRVQFKQQAGRP